MYTYETLDKTDIRDLYETFQQAFSDYQVSFNLSLELFVLMVNRRGFDPACSIGAFREPGHKLVGFILNGVRDWQGRRTAYDLGTGVIPSDRKQGITPHMFPQVLALLAKRGVEQYLLEVLHDNQTAFHIYKRQGLAITRSFSFFTLHKKSCLPVKSPYPIEFVAGFDAEEWRRLGRLWDFNPSWQNSQDSIRAVGEEFAFAVARIDGEIAGYGIVEKKTGDIPQLAVERKHRRKGVATGIISALVESTESSLLRVINVEDSCEGMKRFLVQAGFQRMGGQYEMLLSPLLPVQSVGK